LITENRAHVILRRYYQTIYDCVSDGYARYRDYPDVGIHRSTTAANNINDLIFAELVNRLDGQASPVFDSRNHIRFLKFQSRHPIHLWLKKTDGQHRSSNVQTHHAQMLERGQSEMFPSATLLTLGYWTSPDQSKIRRVSITPPCGRRTKAEWWIDLAVPERAASPQLLGNRGTQIEVRRSSQRRLA
jgi:hypothetical protein